MLIWKNDVPQESQHISINGAFSRNARFLANGISAQLPFLSVDSLKLVPVGSAARCSLQSLQRIVRRTCRDFSPCARTSASYTVSMKNNSKTETLEQKRFLPLQSRDLTCQGWVGKGEETGGQITRSYFVVGLVSHACTLCRRFFWGPGGGMKGRGCESASSGVRCRVRVLLYGLARGIEENHTQI